MGLTAFRIVYHRLIDVGGVDGFMYMEIWVVNKDARKRKKTNLEVIFYQKNQSDLKTHCPPIRKQDLP